MKAKDGMNFHKSPKLLPLKRKCFPLVIDYYLKYCIEGRDLKITLSERNMQYLVYCRSGDK
jgi:hypothetical protein